MFRLLFSSFIFYSFAFFVFADGVDNEVDRAERKSVKTGIYNNQNIGFSLDVGQEVYFCFASDLDAPDHGILLAWVKLDCNQPISEPHIYIAGYWNVRSILDIGDAEYYRKFCRKPRNSPLNIDGLPMIECGAERSAGDRSFVAFKPQDMSKSYATAMELHVALTCPRKENCKRFPSDKAVHKRLAAILASVRFGYGERNEQHRWRSEQHAR